MKFVECASCASKPGSPTLCAACLANRTEIARLEDELDRERAANEALRKGLVAAAHDAACLESRFVAGAHDAACLESRLNGLIVQLCRHTDGVRSEE